MDQLDAMRLFVAVAERRSLTAAADVLDLPRSTVTKVLQRLEKQLGARLLHRTTRRVELTRDGEIYLDRATEILQAFEAMEAAVGNGAKEPRGPLRVEMGTTMAHEVILPALSSFTDRYPDIQLNLGIADRAADILSDRVDCAIRVGEIVDATLVARTIGHLAFATVAAPSYLSRRGVPVQPRDLDTHALITYVSPHTGRPLHQSYRRQKESVDVVGGAGSLSINETSSYVNAALHGLGVAQVLRFMVHRYLRTGELVELLPEWERQAPTVHLAFPSHRHISRRATVFADWATETIRPFCVAP